MLEIGHKVERMFEVHDLKIPSQVVFVATTTATFSLDLWQVHLGHTSLSRLQLLASHCHLGLVQFPKFDCNKQNCHLIMVTLFLLHLLILYILIFGGLTPVSTKGGSRYFVIFVDDFSQYT